MIKVNVRNYIVVIETKNENKIEINNSNNTYIILYVRFRFITEINRYS
jgi:hypothetical protein